MNDLEAVQFICNTCDKTCDMFYEMMNQWVQTDEQPPIHNKINKSFGQETAVVTHEVNHQGEKLQAGEPTDNNIEIEALKQKTGLMKHKVTNTGEKLVPGSKGEQPWIYNKIGKPSEQHTDLVKHEVTHTGEKFFPCSNGDKIYSMLSDLKTHGVKQHREKLQGTFQH